MSDKPYFEENREATLRSWILMNMLRGAGWAAVLVFGIIGFLVILRALAWFLPENPNAALDVIRGGAELASRLV
ncbi:RC-LH1 core complex protein PufX [Fertoebacter nigrum]|uniref:RC-LH1 core complex protein PufX n=1 Tax=Fertoeibacter niger TaxID=2656921 RepID=A0A8X8H0W2_9RHOB|nr:RC-LH1 core complex protein PufX [Fertoeibacter niger]NUB43493.1 RC-LH1 core complex protein PufX [Fertoeibacter niger]